MKARRFGRVAASNAAKEVGGLEPLHSALNLTYRVLTNFLKYSSFFLVSISFSNLA